VVNGISDPEALWLARAALPPPHWQRLAEADALRLEWGINAADALWAVPPGHLLPAGPAALFANPP